MKLTTEITINAPTELVWEPLLILRLILNGILL